MLEVIYAIEINHIKLGAMFNSIAPSGTPFLCQDMVPGLVSEPVGYHNCACLTWFSSVNSIPMYTGPLHARPLLPAKGHREN